MFTTIPCLSVPPFLPHSGAMPDPGQQSQQNNQLELQRHDGQLVLSPEVRVVLQALVRATYHVVMDYFSPLYLRTPYHTSALSGADWVHELLTGHPECIRNELGVYRSTFTMLVKAMQSNGLQSSRHVSIEEQLAIFLYTAVTGLSCTHVGERFQRSSSTITK
jgi:hypothetical protein